LVETLEKGCDRVFTTKCDDCGSLLSYKREDVVKINHPLSEREKNLCQYLGKTHRIKSCIICSECDAKVNV